MSNLFGDKAPIGRRTGGVRRWRRYGFVVIVAAIIAIVVAVIGVMKSNQAGHSRQFTLRMRPSAPLSMAACSAEVAPYGWNIHDGPPSICRLGKGRIWYHGVVTNSGGDAHPACRATGFDARGKVVFSGALFFIFGGMPAGLDAKSHRSTAFTWYLPKVSAPITRYVTFCRVNENPPI